MKKRLLSILLCLCMVLALLPAAALADSSTAPELIKIGGIELTDGKCLTTNEATTATAYTAGDSYVALYKDGVLYLNGLNITKDTQCVWWNYNSSGKHNLTIELVEGTSNTLVRTNGAAINGENGGASGPCLTVRGNGTLNVTGSSYGIWVWEDVIIEGGAAVNATGTNKAGVSNNNTNGGIVVKQGASLTTIGGEYGVESDNGNNGSLSVLGGSFTAIGGTAALEVPADFSGNTVYVGSSASDAQPWNGTTALTGYKYISLTGFSSAVPTYTVTKAAAANGTVAVDFETSVAGESITVTATPDSGYEVDAVTVTDADSGNVAVSGTGNVRTFTMPAKNVTVAVTFAEIGAAPTPGPVTLLNNGYPYGKDMSSGSVTLVMDAENATTYQWQSCATKDGTYEDITGATAQTLTLSSPASGTWYRCVVNGTESKAVQVVKPSESSDVNGYKWTGSYGNSYYITNGTVAYMVNGGRFDVTGFYVKNGTSYMLRTSYSKNWQMYSSSKAEPSALSSTEPNAQLDALRVSFDESDSCAVCFEADLKDGQQAFSFGADTMLGTSATSGNYADRAALIGVVESGVLQHVAMIGAASEAAAKASDPAFVIAPDAGTPASKFWVGNYSGRQPFGSSSATKIEGSDSGMTMSWLNVTSGGSVNFGFKVGSAEATGAVSGGGVSTATGSTTLTLTQDAEAIVVKVDGVVLTEGTDYTIDTTNPLKPVITFKAEAGLTHESVITAEVTFPGETTPMVAPIANNIPRPNTLTVSFNANGHGTAPAAQEVLYNTAATEPAVPTATGYTFSGWYTEADCTNLYDFSAPVIDPMTLYAKWTANVYNVTLHLNDGTVNSGNVTQYTYGVGATLPTDVTKYGFAFQGWYDNIHCIGDPIAAITDTDIGDKVFYARWSVIPSIYYGDETVHVCTKCEVCGGCLDALCTEAVCTVKCTLTGMNFADVAETAWYAESVKYVFHKGLMTGTSATTFAPGATTTRAMIWTVLGRMSGADVNGGAPWYAKAQAWSVVSGVSDGTNPNGAITREQLVTMLYRFAGQPAVTEADKALLNGYTDTEKVSSWAVDAMAWAVSKGIINGTNGALAPQGNAIRSQVAAIFQRFCEM